jgi:hypothetical protein
MAIRTSLIAAAARLSRPAGALTATFASLALLSLALSSLGSVAGPSTGSQELLQPVHCRLPRSPRTLRPAFRISSPTVSSASRTRRPSPAAPTTAWDPGSTSTSARDAIRNRRSAVRARVPIPNSRRLPTALRGRATARHRSLRSTVRRAKHVSRSSSTMTAAPTPTLPTVAWKPCSPSPDSRLPRVAA